MLLRWVGEELCIWLLMGDVVVVGQAITVSGLGYLRLNAESIRAN